MAVLQTRRRFVMAVLLRLHARRLPPASFVSAAAAAPAAALRPHTPNLVTICPALLSRPVPPCVPFKAVPKRVHNGTQISVFWEKEKQYYPAVVTSYCAKSGTYTVEYQDGDVDHHAQLDGPTSLTFSILAGRCSCCGSAALPDPGPMSNCTIPTGFAAVTAGAFNVPALPASGSSVPRASLAASLSGVKPVILCASCAFARS